MPGYASTLVAALGDGTALNTSTTETSILPAESKILLPARYIDRPGKAFNLRVTGRLSNIVTTPGTLTLRVKLGATANIAVATSQAFALSTTAHTTVGFDLDLDLLVRAVGSGTAANIMANGHLVSEALGSSRAAVAGVADSAVWQNTPVVGTGFDSSVVNQFDVTAQFSVSNAGNAIQVHTCRLTDLLTTP